MGRKNLWLLWIGLLACGCVQRTLHITSEPSGALITANDQEIGRTPIVRDFVWYGTYDVEVRKEGYQTLHARTRVIAPWWQWPPFDFFAEFWPFHLKDIRHIHYTLVPQTNQQVDPTVMMAHADEMRERMEGSQFTRPPTTAFSATNPATKPSTRSSTQPSTMPTTTQASR